MFVLLLQTLAWVLQGVFSKEGFETFNYDVVSCLMDPEHTDDVMLGLLDAVRQILRKADSPPFYRNMAVQLILIVVTATENLNANSLVECFMRESFFDVLIKLFASKDHRELHGTHALAILGLLSNFKKFEIDNPYASALAEVSDDVVLSGIASVICSVLMEKNREWTAESEEASKSMFSSFGALIGGIFGGGAEGNEERFMPEVANAGAALLALYETVRLNAHFVTVITHISILDAPASAAKGGGGGGGAKGQHPHSASKLTTGPNLLSTFLTFSSFVFTDTSKAGAGEPFARLCWSILTCICEDVQANAFLHDDNMTVAATLYRMEMRHRPGSLQTIRNGPLVEAVLELSIEFLFSHLKRDLQVDLYSHCLGVGVGFLTIIKFPQRIRLAFVRASIGPGRSGPLVARIHDCCTMPRYTVAGCKV
jgi:hypothetical protein